MDCGVTDDRALRLAEGAIIAGTALGFALSYSALQRLAAAHGYSAWEACTWPLAVDFVAVSTTALAMALARRRGGPTGETWAVAGAAALVSLSGNVVSAWGDPVAMAMHGWAAAVYIALWHCYWRASAESRAEPLAITGAAVGHEPAQPGPPVDTTPPWPAMTAPPVEKPTIPVAPAAEVPDERSAAARSAGSAREQVRALVEAAHARGARLTGAEVAQAIGRSQPRARALLAEVRAELPVPANGGRGRAAL
jgi:Protein of unknown function (DUF2637)